jgi:L-ribulose-5-phosphate 4-epimerase
MCGHGVFAVGATAREAVKAAVMCEDAARTVHLARTLGTPRPLSPDQIDALHRRYKEDYGQPGAGTGPLDHAGPAGSAPNGPGPH